MPKPKRKGARAPRRTESPKTHPSPRKRAPKARPAPQRLAGKSQPLTRWPLFQVDAFTKRRFHGNPAAVVLLGGKWPEDEVLQVIAAENNLSETAFVIPRGTRGGTPRFGLRWFTPLAEVDLCGHATLATAHVLWAHRHVRGARIVFDTLSGPLPVERLGELIVLDFPSRPGQQIPMTGQLSAALGRAPTEVYKAGNKIMAVFDNRRDVYALEPDFKALALIEAMGVIVTAPGASHDFVSRFFAPRLGLDEDPVTGSSHCTLVPYWAKRLGKSTMFAHQVSKRGGELMCEDRGSRVRLGGHAVTFSEGSLLL
jgi:PhzF family phenazine biosynthesis protein